MNQNKCQQHRVLVPGLDLSSSELKVLPQGVGYLMHSLIDIIHSQIYIHGMMLWQQYSRLDPDSILLLTGCVAPSGKTGCASNLGHQQTKWDCAALNWDAHCRKHGRNLRVHRQRGDTQVKHCCYTVHIHLSQNMTLAADRNRANQLYTITPTALIRPAVFSCRSGHHITQPMSKSSTTAQSSCTVSAGL